MVAHLRVPHLPILLFIFLAVRVHAIPPSLPTTYDGSICSESFMCGGVTISYPFYLSNAIRETTDDKSYYSCGYTDLKISCQGEGPTGTPVISLDGENYTVQHIFYDFYTIILADNDVFVADSCPAVRHGVSFNETWLHNTSTNDNLTFLFGCDQRDALGFDAYKYKIKCTGFKSQAGVLPGDAFVFTSDELELDTKKHLEQELATNCGKVVTVPVIGDVLREAASNQSNFTSGGYGHVLKGGFELGWSPIAADQCQQCEESYGRCACSTNRVFMGCLCNGGKVGQPDCKHIVRSSSKSVTSDF